jgi:hypothetical protein
MLLCGINNHAMLGGAERSVRYKMSKVAYATYAVASALLLMLEENRGTAA